MWVDLGMSRSFQKGLTIITLWGDTSQLESSILFTSQVESWEDPMVLKDGHDDNSAMSA